MPRNREYTTNADRQRAYRQREKVLTHPLCPTCQGCGWVTDTRNRDGHCISICLSCRGKGIIRQSKGD